MWNDVPPSESNCEYHLRKRDTGFETVGRKVGAWWQICGDLFPRSEADARGVWLFGPKVLSAEQSVSTAINANASDLWTSIKDDENWTPMDQAMYPGGYFLSEVGSKRFAEYMRSPEGIESRRKLREVVQRLQDETPEDWDDAIEAKSSEPISPFVQSEISTMMREAESRQCRNIEWLVLPVAGLLAGMLAGWVCSLMIGN